MTKEQKAKAYDEALERARKQRDEYQKEFDKTDKDSRLASILRAAISAVEMAFPELADNEDERIRKELINQIEKSRHHPADKARWIAYLEKQKECVSNNFDDVWAEEDCEEIIAEGQKLTPRFKELLKEVCHAWYDRGAKLEKQKSGLSFVGDFQAKTLQGPIELAEWKEAAKIREWILAKMQELAATGVPCSDEIKMADKAIDYLIKQKEYIEEPKIAFGDWGDKEKKEAIITCLKYMRFIKKITNQEYDDLIKWLANNTISNVSEKEKCLREVKQKEQKLSDFPAGFYVTLPDGKKYYTKEMRCKGMNIKVVEPKPAEWSEEDEQNLNVCLSYIKDEPLRSWLKDAIRVRYDKSVKWSEEDEKIRQSIIKDIEFERNYTSAETGKVIEKYDEQVKWLKSLSLNLKKKNEDIAKLCSNEWSEEDKAHRDFILESLENQIRFCKKDAKGAHYTKQIRTAQNWLKSLPERFNFESKPAECNKVTINGEPIPTENHSVDIPLAEWSDEDEDTINLMIAILRENYSNCLFKTNSANTIRMSAISTDMLIKRIEALRPQPKQEWNEEDEKMLKWAIRIIVEYSDIDEEGSEIVQNWLESLRPQYHGDVTMTEAYKMGKEAGEASRWKPTEHQMNILKAVKEYVGKGSGYWGEGLGSLIDDLEKL